ncbi:hypothetical protein EVC45_37515 [Paraburkholderia sp. UYCP14C]|uniref:hypothetical protein n=1 Tax=Paraburkholderia sp. UYCP14C TaxID=2511130 RepID=UPI0010212855|nr:hypothetical protein [Paraburkholderia sp. UYCP14C]RZF24665.1 hypothetical protein EVC45_37515 [Paraburkholderia sp. UYCP14C]
MRLIISSFLRTLRERDEFDRLLPDLLSAMGYVPVARPQTGVRQYGVDLPVVGKNPVDGVEELVLLTIKQGDLGRQDWDGSAQAVRQSLDEIIEVCLPRDLEPAHQPLRKRIILATTGDLKQDTQRNWTAYIEKRANEAQFEFWGGDKVADLIERHMLDEHVFVEDDRTNLRKALAFAGEQEYSLADLERLLRRQLGLGKSGELDGTVKDGKPLVKAITRLNLALHMFAKAAQDAGDTRQALVAAELFMLKTWHRIQSSSDPSHRQVRESFMRLSQTYMDVAMAYVRKMAPYMMVRDGMSGYTRESAEYGVVLLEHVGLVATTGLAIFCLADDSEHKTACGIADLLAAMLANMPATASPRLDRNAIDVSLALLSLTMTNRHAAALGWLSELCGRLLFSFRRQLDFPISSDSFDDLVEFKGGQHDELIATMMGASWMSAYVFLWCVALGMEREYANAVELLRKEVPQVVPQVWHPDSESEKRMFFGPIHTTTGNTEIMEFPSSAEALRERINKFLEHDPITSFSEDGQVGFHPMEMIAVRHYRTPFPVKILYGLSRLGREDAAEDSAEQPEASPGG